MTARTTRNEAWGWFEHPLTAAETGEKGELVCLDTSTGLLAMGAAGSATLRPLGVLDNGDGITTGDGTTNVRIRLFKEKRLWWFDNDTGGTPVVAADIGSDCYVFDKRTVTGDSVGNSVAGKVWALNTLYGVLIEGVGSDAG